MDDQELMELASEYGVDMSDYDDAYPGPHGNGMPQSSTRYSGYYDFDAFDDEPGAYLRLLLLTKI